MPIDFVNVQSNSSCSVVKFCLVHAHNGQSSGHVVFDNDSRSVIDNDCNSLAGLCSLLSMIILLLRLLSSLFVFMFISRVSWVLRGLA